MVAGCFYAFWDTDSECSIIWNFTYMMRRGMYNLGKRINTVAGQANIKETFSERYASPSGGNQVDGLPPASSLGPDWTML